MQFDVHAHLDLYKNRDEVIKKAEQHKIYVVSMTNLPELYEKYIREEYNDFQLLTYRRICQEVLQGRFRTVELWNSRQGKIYFLCREDTGRKIVVDYSGTVCYTSKDYDVLQASMKREHVTADSILIFSENGYEKTLTEGTVQILVHSVDENS